MSKEQNSFDVVSKVETQEVNNAVSQAMKEISTRFDFKGSKSNITFDGKEEIVLVSDDEQKLKSVVDILKEKLTKRKVALNALNYEKVQEAAGNTVRQVVKLQQGIPSEKAKEIVKIIKTSKHLTYSKKSFDLLIFSVDKIMWAIQLKSEFLIK